MTNVVDAQKTLDPRRLERAATVLDRGVVAKLLPSREFVLSRLAADTPLRIYIGADPTGSDLHLSHAKNYMLLEEFRQLGHTVIVLFGDFTARIGDPTDRTSARSRLTEAVVAANVDSWLRQIRPLIDFDDPVNPAQIKFNSEWLAKLTLAEVVELTSLMTVQRMLERTMFERRIERQEPIHLHEFLYPLMQGYDSVAMGIDIELCGTDQEFNALVGRTLLSRMENREKGVIEVNLMENPLTGDLMSKSRGTGVFLDGSSENLYGQVMALPDEMTRVCFINVTRIPLPQVDEIMAGHPRDAKMTLARVLVEKFHGADAAVHAEREFRLRFVERQRPSEVPEVASEATTLSAIDLGALGGGKRFASRSAVRRVIVQGGMRVEGKRVQNPDELFSIPPGGLDVRLGKLVWFRALPADSGASSQ
jgi:tyrosyl-tRNA synthetase